MENKTKADMGNLSRQISIRSTISLPALNTFSALSSQNPSGISYFPAGNVGSSRGPTGLSQRMGRKGIYSLEVVSNAHAQSLSTLTGEA